MASNRCLVFSQSLSVSKLLLQAMFAVAGYKDKQISVLPKVAMEECCCQHLLTMSRGREGPGCQVARRVWRESLARGGHTFCMV